MSQLGYRILGICFLMIVSCIDLKAQNTNAVYRIAKIKVDANQLTKYKLALREQMETALKMESGVISYTAVADKKDSTSIIILEVYTDLKSYQSHILTTHFKKYKETVKEMVLSLDLIDTELIYSDQKDKY